MRLFLHRVAVGQTQSIVGYSGTLQHYSACIVLAAIRAVDGRNNVRSSCITFLRSISITECMLHMLKVVCTSQFITAAVWQYATCAWPQFAGCLGSNATPDHSKPNTRRCAYHEQLASSSMCCMDECREEGSSCRNGSRT